MDRAAVVYAVNGRIVIAANPKTTTGLRLHMDPTVLPMKVTAEFLALQLQVKLQRSDHILPHPVQSEWKGSFNLFLKAAGVRSFRAFMTLARLIEVDQNDQEITVTPTRNCGPKEGFEAVQAEAESFSGDMRAVAETVLRHLSQ